MPLPDSEVQLSFESSALERCYDAAEILRRDFGEPCMEYALLGLSTEAEPLHVVATPLLPGQRVTPASVEQPGHQVLRMRGEIERLSQRMQRKLLPIVFIHRHPSECGASTIDEAFLRGVFIDQVSTVVSFEEHRVVAGDGKPHCACPGMQQHLRESLVAESAPLTLRGECGIAFSMIVNGRREHRLYAVRKRWCPFCGEAEVGDLAVRLAPDSRGRLSTLDRALLRRELAREIRAKLRFEQEDDWTTGPSDEPGAEPPQGIR